MYMTHFPVVAQRIFKSEPFCACMCVCVFLCMLFHISLPHMKKLHSNWGWITKPLSGLIIGGASPRFPLTKHSLFPVCYFSITTRQKCSKKKKKIQSKESFSLSFLLQKLKLAHMSRSWALKHMVRSLKHFVSECRESKHCLDACAQESCPPHISLH